MGIGHSKSFTALSNE